MIRKLKGRGDIEGYKVISGVYHIKVSKNSVFEEISHISDFGKYGLNIEGLIK